MNEAIARVHTGSVTYAIKDTSVDGKQIHQGDFMGIFEKDIVNTSKDKVQATCELLDKMLDSDCEIVTLIRGSDATEEECRSVEEHISANHSVDVDVENGGQPVYSFIIGVE
jgi:dihydroxyacetone kinase-like predicted kinase